LLDANVLIGAIWPKHGFHKAAERWFAENANEGWATCPLTQLAFVRILSNPSFSREAITTSAAAQLLRDNLKHPAHEFWPDDVTFAEALDYFAPRLTGHTQTTDAYLLGLAMHRKGKLVTFNRGVLALAGEHAAARAALVIL
jgi:toxin-antitoxin system PIN domain toxin